MLDLYLLQETLLYVEQQHEWLSYIQSTINEREQEYKILHSKLSSKFNEELNKQKSSSNTQDSETDEHVFVHIKREAFDNHTENFSVAMSEDMMNEDVNFDKFHNNSLLEINAVSQQSLSNTSDNASENLTLDHYQNTISHNTCPEDLSSGADSLTLKQDNTSFLLQPSTKGMRTSPEINSTQIEKLQMHCPKNVQECKGGKEPSKLGLLSSKNSYADHDSGKTFTSGTERDVHLKLHEREKFDCFLCKKSFKGKALLNMHLRTHTGEKPFKCSICSKSFTQQGNLTQHFTIHSGVKPFVCVYCNRKFTRRYGLRRHLRLHKCKTEAGK